MTADKFWMGWLKITMIMIIVAGVFLVVLGNTAYAEILNKQINRIFYSGKIPEQSVLFMRGWLIGVSGAVMAGWGSSMLYIVCHPFKKFEKWSWRSIFYPLLLWFILDSTVSAYYGSLFNVLINSVLFLQILAPLLFLKTLFFPKPKIIS